MKLNVGDRVELAPFEDYPLERGTVDSIPEHTDSFVYVTLDQEFIAGHFGGGDACSIEVPVNQITVIEEDQTGWVGKHVKVFVTDGEGEPTTDVLATGIVVQADEFHGLEIKPDDEFVERVSAIIESGLIPAETRGVEEIE
jgi:hypothetical protein